MTTEKKHAKAMRRIAKMINFVADDDQYEEWGTKADWACLLDDVQNGLRDESLCGTGGVEQADIDLAVAALKS